MNSGGEDPSEAREELVLGEVVAEHLDELEFCIAQHRRMHSHPLMTLPELAQGLEDRLCAHLDGIVVAGPEACLEMAKRFAVDIDPERPARMAAVAMALAANGLEEVVGSFFGHEDRGVRLAAARGCSLAGRARLEKARSGLLRRANGAGEIGAWLEVMGHRDMQPGVVEGFLKSDDAQVVAGALRCLRQPIPALGALVQRLVEHEEALVRERALRVALAWNTGRALAICEEQAFDSALASPWAISLYAVLCGPAQRARLALSADSKERTPHVLRALGLSGSPDVVPALLERLGGQENEAKIAAQAIAAIAGLDLRKDEFAAREEPEPAESPPPLEEEDLDADLVPGPEEALERPNAEAIRAWWTSRASERRAPQRYVLGKPRTPESLFEALESGPLGLRAGWAMSLQLWSGGAFWLDSEALSTAQGAQVSQGRAALGQWPSEAAPQTDEACCEESRRSLALIVDSR